MKVGELFSGVGGFSLGFEAAGIETAWHCEIDPDARAVLQRHWPDVPCYDDVTTINGADLEPVDIITFGSPCQDLSIAGNRHGLDGARSNLFFEACRIIEEMRHATGFQYPRYAVWENVHGSLSSKKGADFERVLDELAYLGPVVIEWHVLNALNFGVAQRRRRVFVIACFDPRIERVGEILPVAESVRRDSKARKAAQPGTAGAARGGPIAAGGVVQGLTCSYGKGGPDDNKAQAGWLVPDHVGPLLAAGNGNRGHRVGAEEAASGHIIPESVPALTAPLHGQRYDDQQSQQLIACGLSENQRGELYLNEDHVRAINIGGGKPGQGYPAIAYSIYPESGQGADLRATEATVAPTISSTDGEKMTDRGIRVVDHMHVPEDEVGACEKTGRSEEALQVLRNPLEAEAVPEREAGRLDRVPAEEVLRPRVHALGVRRLTPLECERLQGWPDDHTRWRADGSEVKDSARYRMIGNGVVAPVTRWIGKHLMRVESEL